MGPEQTIAVILEAGEAVETDKLYVIASKDAGNQHARQRELRQ